jgi:rubrerythrin
MLGVLVPPSFSQSNISSTFILDKPGGSRYTLTVTFTDALYNYYANKVHPSNAHPEGYVTPLVFTQMATQLRSVFPDDEDFANAVLMITHQLTYQVDYNLHYPVETLASLYGDCDEFSVLAASIMKSGGLDVVLLTYPNHMNLGVYLPSDPTEVRTGKVTWAPFNGKNYYIAETTGGYGDSAWRIGEDSTDYGEAEVIPIQNVDNSSPGQISAALNPVNPPSSPTSSAPTFSGSSQQEPFQMIGLFLIAVAFFAVILLVIVSVSKGKKQPAKQQHSGTENTTQLIQEKPPIYTWYACPKCGNNISQTLGIDHCPSCGTTLPKGWEKQQTSNSFSQQSITQEQTVQRINQEPSSFTWYVCPVCGTRISRTLGIDHCPSCGTKFPKGKKLTEL